MISQVKTVFHAIYPVVSIWIIWIILHWGSDNLHNHLCTHRSLMGLITSPFYVATPHCRGLNWLRGAARDNIVQMWMVIGTLCMARLGSILTTTVTTTTSTQTIDQDDCDNYTPDRWDDYVDDDDDNRSEVECGHTSNTYTRTHPHTILSDDLTTA